MKIGEGSPVDTDVNQERADVNKCNDEWTVRAQEVQRYIAWQQHRYKGTSRLS